MLDFETEDMCTSPRLRTRVKTDRSSRDDDGSSGSTGLGLRRAPNKKKAGRPIAYRGDPDSKALTETERRKVKRRTANRESARRVRAKRAGTTEELQVKVDRLTDRNSSLLKHVAEAEGASAAIRAHIEDFSSKLKATLDNSNVLQQQIAFLQEQQEDHSESSPFLGVPESLCSDSQELLVAGMPCCSDLMRCDMAAEDIVCTPFQSCFDSQLEDTMLCM